MFNNNGYALAKRIIEDTIEIIETFTELKDLKKYEGRGIILGILETKFEFTLDKNTNCY